MRAAIYLRVSTDEQTNGYGLDVQSERTRGMATVKGWAVVEPPFVDEGISGALDESERPGLAALLYAAETGKLDAVIVSALDRLGRKTSLVLSLVERFAACNVAIISCKESLDTSTPAGQFVLTMFAALAQLERDTIVERTTAGRNVRGRKDGERGGRVPMGYRRTFDAKGKADGIEIDSSAAEIVKEIFAQRAEGATLQTIADTLNFNGIPTPRGGQWHHSSVRVVLGNEDLYQGGLRGDSCERWPVVLAESAIEAGGRNE